VFLTRAHAQGLETESLSHAEAQAISRQIRASGRAISNQSILSEVRERDGAIEKLQRQKRKKATVTQRLPEAPQPPAIEEHRDSEHQQSQSKPEDSDSSVAEYNGVSSEGEIELVKAKKLIPYVRVRDHEQMRRESGLL
jgi:putative transposase